MANRVAGMTEKLQEQAMREFCEKGYMGASLRTISENAGTTPRSIYTRYGDKEGLFSALVSHCAESLRDLFGQYMEGYTARPADEQRLLFHDEKFDAEYQGYIDTIITFVYENWDTVKLLVCKSEGTKYAGFVDEIVRIDEKYTLKYIETTGNDVLTSGRATEQLVHLLCSSFIHGFFEFVRHDMEREEAKRYIVQLQSFFACGWDHLFNP
ncbi:MAG: TetR/AcrR family transcriptional regulator [Blautia sp.]|nr:TetR/AcrR family transcriptional regulator [Blautia sp.]